MHPDPATFPVSPWLRLHLLLFPASCIGCGAAIDALTHGHPGHPHVCSSCHESLPWRVQNEPLQGAEVSSDAAEIDWVWAPWQYTEPVNRWIHELKYDLRDATAIGLGRLAADAEFGAAPLADVDIVAPVPLHRRRLRERGFNQALLVAHHWRRTLRRQGHAVPVVVPDLLARTRYTVPQAKLAAADRKANVAGAFGPGRASIWRKGVFPLAGLRILLVDDVMTTGATLGTCAAVLREAGADAVDAFVLAKTD